MPRGMMDRRMMGDGRNPYGSRGGYVTSSRRGRGRDRMMGGDYGRGDYNYDSRQYGRGRDSASYPQSDRERDGRDYQRDRQSDMGRDYADMRGSRDMRDMHHMGRGEMYRPVEAMGYFTGYYGGGDGRDYGDYNDYDDYGDYGDYDDYGDYGETLNREELEHWKKKLMKEVEEGDKQFFSKENIEQKAKQLGVSMKEFNEEELAVATLMMYTDYCKTIKPIVGPNMDIYIKMARDFLTDPDANIKGGEKLAVYHDCIVEGK